MRGRNDLARQGEVHGPARFRRCDRESAVNDGRQLLGVSQLVIPFDDLTDHARLIVHFLRPMDVAIARPRQTGLGQRRPACGEENGNVLARCIHGRADHIGGSDTDVHHHGRYPPGYHAVTVCHCDGEIFVGRQDRPRHGDARLRSPRIGLDEWRKIGPRIAEQIVDASISQQGKVGPRNVFGLLLFRSVAGLQARSHRGELPSRRPF